MRFRLNPSQERQLRAIEAVLGLFSGQPKRLARARMMAGGGAEVGKGRLHRRERRADG